MPNVNLPEPPQLNLSNPSLASAGEFGSAASHAYAAGLQFATALKDQELRGQQQRQAAANEAALNKQKSDSEYAREVAELNKTGRPLTQAEIGGANSGVPQPTALPPDEDAPPGTANGGFSAPAANPTFTNGPDGVSVSPTRQPIDPKNIQYDSRMQPWFVNSPEQMEAIKKTPAPLTDQNSFIVPGNLAKQLGLAEGTRLPYEHAQGLVNVFNAANGTEEQDINTKDFRDEQGNMVPMMIGRKTGQAKPLILPPGVTAAEATEAGSWDPVPGGRGQNGEMLLRNTKTGETKLSAVPPGATIGLTPEQQEIANRHAESMARLSQDHAENMARLNQFHEDAENDKQRTAVEGAQKQITAYQLKEQEQHGVRSAYGQALAVANGQKVVDPKDGKTYSMNDARRAAYQRAFDDATQKVGVYHDSQQKIMKRFGCGDSAAGSQQPGSPATAQAAPPQTSGPISSAQTPPAQQAPAAPPKAQQQQTPAKASPGQQPAGTTTTASAYREGQTATGPSGAKLIFQGGKWVPLTTQ